MAAAAMADATMPVAELDSSSDLLSVLLFSPGAGGVIGSTAGGVGPGLTGIYIASSLQTV